MKKNQLILIISCVIMSAIAPICFAQRGQIVKLTGSVLNECDDSPVNEAKITFIGRTENTSTDENGNFSIILENAAEITMRVTKEDFETFALNDPSTNRPLTIKLEPEAGCDTTGVTISITGFRLDDYIAGTISGIETSQYQKHKVIVYVQTDNWYIHPYVNSYAKINNDGSWRIETIDRSPSPDRIAAFLVKKNFKIPKEVKRLGAIEHVARHIIEYEER